ncbi:MAG: hypothetical protein FD163_733 [Hyphomonadaceae bacterium]|nr:MAG: hypothetical protein FD128_1194 [Hyphomonadaceae bacterium]KAF0186065.1 MAG: hypothetical protein FD163_733 [Hyphomonadaceae bacterium]
MALDEKVVEKSEDELFEIDNSNELPPADIFAYNELRSCADLFRMYEKGQLEVDPHFQRDTVWEPKQRLLFIDSLNKQLPIPSLCLALDIKSGNWSVIDGLQRLHTVMSFLNGAEIETKKPKTNQINVAKRANVKLSEYDGIDPLLARTELKLFKDAPSDTELGKIFSRIENVTLPLNILRCDFSNDWHMEYLFTIFSRLNSGGLKLTNQEIRNCIFSGPFNNLLKELESTPEWKELLVKKSALFKRFKGQEILLRFFAFFDAKDTYDGKMSSFLNKYMKANRKISETEIAAKKELLLRTIRVVNCTLDNAPELKKRSITVIEAFLIGAAKNIEHLERLSLQDKSRLFRALEREDPFTLANLKEGLATETKVKNRLDTAINSLAEF